MKIKQKSPLISLHHLILKPQLVLGLATILLCIGGNVPEISAEIIDTVVASVNEEVITLSELQEATEMFMHQMGKDKKQMPSK